ncbi:MAG: AMP-binding protein [Actinomycetota bacterium]
MALPWSAHLPDPSHDWLPDELAARSLTAAWGRRWREDPDRPALWAEGDGWVSRGELDRRSAAVAGHLRSLGVGPGARVLLSAASSIELVVSHAAVLRAGAIVVPVHTGYTERELGHVLADAEPVLAILDEPGRTAAIAADLPVIAPGDGADGEAPDDLDRAGPDDPALLPYTSGTTGRPKGVVLRHRNLVAGAAAVATAWRWTDADRLVLCLPLFHMHGLGVGIHGTLLTGGSAVILPRFEPDAVFDAAAEHDASMYFGVPTMYARLVDHDRVAELGRLRLCVSGSAPLPAELHVALTERTGQRVIERYGMTETVMNISNPFDGDRRPGSVGLPLPGVEARIAGGADEGEIELRGPNVFSEYWGRPDATAEAFTADGWFRTGDVGTQDDDGYWRIVGRSKELIISGGFNVFPREVEDVLVEHPAVAEAAVAGTPDDEWGEIVTAIVVADGGQPVDEDELRSFCADRLVNYKRPRLVHVVDSLPRNAMGKIVRPDVDALARELAAG